MHAQSLQFKNRCIESIGHMVVPIKWLATRSEKEITRHMKIKILRGVENCQVEKMQHLFLCPNAAQSGGGGVGIILRLLSWWIRSTQKPLFNCRKWAPLLNQPPTQHFLCLWKNLNFPHRPHQSSQNLQNRNENWSLYKLRAKCYLF